MNRSTSPTSVPQASARERLLAAANELFYAEGVQTVGIDRVIERAGVAKASLYNLFGSKEELVAAYLQSRHDATADRLIAAIDKLESPREKIMAIFESQAKLFRSPDFRGCAFTSASAEAPAGGRVELAADEFRAWIRTLFVDLARAAGAAHPTVLGRQLHLLYDGAGLAARMEHGDQSISKSTREAVRTLLDAAIS
ncbi:MAG TPA: TetR/AcrR family transcriptional regulator [Acidimicrobiales bacterium]|nr:TetR/AcrR family transcriptional regulator [Acidimicrobiales bacterium]